MVAQADPTGFNLLISLLDLRAYKTSWQLLGLFGLKCLAAAGLAIIIVYHLDEVMKASGGSGFLPIFNPVLRGAFFEIPALGLSVASFAFSWKRHLIIISILLLISGSIMVADRIAIRDPLPNNSNCT